MRLRGVHIIHRHGDRSPLTKLRCPSSEYWQTQLAPPLSAQDEPLGREGRESHASDAGPQYGQLTSLGQAQLTRGGVALRRSILEDSTLVRPQPLCSAAVSVTSTPFPRTILSARAFLSGFLDPIDGAADGGHIAPGVNVDANTRMIAGQKVAASLLPINTEDWQDLIPDGAWLGPALSEAHNACWADNRLDSWTPPPAAREDAAEAARSRLTQLLREVGVLGPGSTPETWNHLHDAVRCCRGHMVALRAALSAATCDAIESSGGGGGSDGGGGAHLSDQVAELAQLADMAVKHNTWRWFALQSHPRVAQLSAGRFVERFLQGTAAQAASSAEIGCSTVPFARIYSAHDSTIIALMGALGLKGTAADGSLEFKWPDYAAVLRADVLSADDGRGSAPLLRFSLNGEPLFVAEHAHEHAVPLSAVRPVWSD